MSLFDCDRCGACCRNVHLSDLGAELNRGDGVCKNFDEATRLCKIYAERPIFCNVDAYYEKFLSRKMSRSEFHELNKKICHQLKGAIPFEN